MRRSKSNPAKYVKNYRSLSQRRMTEVQQPLPSSSVLAEAPSSALAPSFVSSNNKDNGEDRHPPPSPVIPIILSNELQQEYGPDEVAILEGSNKTHKASKHSTTNTKHTTISVQELTHATRQSKQDRKKSLQLAQRAAAKQKRAALYAALQACAVPAAHRPLLHSSAQWSSIGINSSNNNSSSGKQSKSNQSTDAEAMVLPTKRLRRNHALLRQRAGLDCVDATTTGTHSSSNSNPIQDDNRTHAKPDNDNTDTDDDDNLDTDDHMEDAQRPPAPNTNTPTTNTKLPHPLQTNRDTATPKSDVDEGEPKRSLKRPRSTTGNTTNNSSPTPCADFERTTGDDVMDTAAQNNNHASSAIPLAATDAALSSTNDSLLSVPPPASTTVLPCTSAATEAGAGRFLATQMMASLVTLQKKTKSTTEPTQQHPLSTSNDTPGPNDGSLAVRKSSKQESVKYVPSDPISLQTTQSYSKVATAQTNAGGVVVPGRNLVRPPSVTAVRYDLPVATMEFDIMEAIRNHDVTILCAATGSGKSTQIPQFLYEAGLSRSMTETAPETSMPNSRCIIGVTQPRRVAAVSTAKRVCYEMGLGSGSSISSNNVVAYQTRHETAGYGRNTQIKFMTDGILLQEIQKDLLLRQYSVIVLDEAHERNLNTDVLLGLLSAALPLRQLAAAEANSTIRPLKVVIMSATLRVQDFTNQPRLFSSPTTTTVVTVPGRTYPVTIHHNKVTELDSYGMSDALVSQKLFHFHIH